MAKTEDWYNPDDPDVPPIWEWLAQQHNNTDPTRAAAARYVSERWGYDTYYRHRKVLPILQSEDSEHLHGIRLLTQDYVELFDLTPTEQVRDQNLGVVSPLVPVGRDQCTHTFRSGQHCTRDAIPGTDLCGNHGGGWISETERAEIAKRVSERIVDASERAVTALLNLVDNAKSEHVRYEASTAILDRAGIGPISKVELSITPRAEEAGEAIKGRLLKLAARDGGIIVPGEVLESRDEPLPIEVEGA